MPGWGYLIVMAAGLFGAGWTLARWLAARELARNDASHAQTKQDVEKLRDAVRAVEGSISKLQADLPKEYVMRQEWIRFVDNVGRDVRDLSGKFDQLLKALYEGKTRTA